MVEEDAIRGLPSFTPHWTGFPWVFRGRLGETSARARRPGVPGSKRRVAAARLQPARARGASDGIGEGVASRCGKSSARRALGGAIAVDRNEARGSRCCGHAQRGQG